MLIVPGQVPNPADYGAALAAGPLAHAKYLTGDMFALDMFSEFDRRAIAEAAESGDPAAFLAASIQRAAAALDIPAVWSAVEALAAALSAYWPEPDQLGEGVMDGDAALAIITGAGAWPGMAGFGETLRWRARRSRDETRAQFQSVPRRFVCRNSFAPRARRDTQIS